MDGSEPANPWPLFHPSDKASMAAGEHQQPLKTVKQSFMQIQPALNWRLPFESSNELISCGSI
jgi:hypothetical protein